jgi:hypothetical protein
MSIYTIDVELAPSPRVLAYLFNFLFGALGWLDGRFRRPEA